MERDFVTGVERVVHPFGPLGGVFAGEVFGVFEGVLVVFVVPEEVFAPVYGGAVIGG